MYPHVVFMGASGRENNHVIAQSKANLSEIQHFLRHKKATTTELYFKSSSPGGQVMADILDAHYEEQAEVKKDKEGAQKN